MSRSIWSIDSSVASNASAFSPARMIRTLSMTTSVVGLLGPLTATPAIASTISKPPTTLPKTEWFPARMSVKSSHGVAAWVMKNWLPFVCSPELAIERTPGPSCLRSG